MTEKVESIPTFTSLQEAVECLTEWRYEDPLFVGQQLAEVSESLLKMRVEGWSGDLCVPFARTQGKNPEDFTEDIFSAWDQEEAAAGFTALPNLRDFDCNCGDYGQHFAFFYKSLDACTSFCTTTE